MHIKINYDMKKNNIRISQQRTHTKETMEKICRKTGKRMEKNFYTVYSFLAFFLYWKNCVQH